MIIAVLRKFFFIAIISVSAILIGQIKWEEKSIANHLSEQIEKPRVQAWIKSASQKIEKLGGALPEISYKIRKKTADWLQPAAKNAEK